MLFFSIFLQFISSWLQGPSSIAAFRCRVFHGVVWLRLEVYIIFFSDKIFKRFFREAHFRSSFFCIFAFNHGALNLRLQALALPELYDISHRRHFTPGHATPGHATPVHFTPCHFTPRTFHPTYVSPHVRFTPRAFHPKDMSLRIIELVRPNNILYKPVDFMKIFMPID